MTRPRPPRILTDNRSFRNHLHALVPGDAVVGMLNIKPAEETLYLYLSEAGVRLFPSALAQQLSRSKCLQAIVFAEFMVPETFVARDRHDMIVNINRYGQKGIGPVVTKQNRLNCGLGVHRWASIEEAYNQASFGSLGYPFVVQPLVEGATDVRVIIIGQYIEAYWRRNRHTFRNNLFFGGESGLFELSPEQRSLCADVMAKGKFPHAHIDLLITVDGTTYVSEINLRGGLKGAAIPKRDYDQRISALEREFLASL